MGKVSGFFSIRVFVDVSFVLLSMSKRAGNKLEKLLGGHRQPVSFVKSSSRWIHKEFKRKVDPKKLVGKKDFV